MGTQIEELLEVLASRAARARARVVIVAVRLAEDVLVLLLHVRHLLVVWLSWDSERRESGPISPVDHTEDLPLILASIGNKRVPSGTLTMALHRVTSASARFFVHHDPSCFEQAQALRR